MEVGTLYKAPGDAYRRILRNLSTSRAAKPGGAAGFAPDQLTQTAVTIYLEQLQAAGYNRSTRCGAPCAGLLGRLSGSIFAIMRGCDA